MSLSVGTEALRGFVAVPVPEELLAPVQRVQQRLQSGLPKGAVRWIPPEQVHLTLTFLGNVARAHLAELKAALETVCRHSPALVLRAAGVGCFPSPGRPRIIWVGLEGDLAALEQLQSQIVVALQPWSERHESRTFGPHLTIGRVRDIIPRAARQVRARAGETSPASLGECRVAEVRLMESKLSPNGAEHVVLASAKLRGSSAEAE